MLQVQFEVADATKREFGNACFDVIYSRDTILHIKDKAALFASFLVCFKSNEFKFTLTLHVLILGCVVLQRWLKPGGRVLISDYCCSEGDHSQVFKDYVSQRGYHLLSPANYGKVSRINNLP